MHLINENVRWKASTVKEKDTYAHFCSSANHKPIGRFESIKIIPIVHLYIIVYNHCL